MLAATALVLAACSSGGDSSPKTTAGTSGQTSTSGAPSSPTVSSKLPKPAKPVHIKLKFGDGQTFGVGIPIIAYFSRRPADGTPLAKATTLTINGSPAKGAWFFEYSEAEKGFPVEGHYRMAQYWPAHARIHLALATKGVSAGHGLAYDDSLTLDFSTGAAHILTVDDYTHRMTVTSDGRPYGTFPVSLGASSTPTLKGVKVIMEKGADIRMTGPGYDDPHVKFTQRLTYGGEYLHSAPWNTGNIGRFDSSNGCTNLLPADAQRLYGYLEIGDVVKYPNANGRKMQLGLGYGDWNVPWGQWQTGGIVAMN